VKKAKAKTAREKAQKEAKEHFNQAIELDPVYVKPLY
jgi:hypothetical protein